MGGNVPGHLMNKFAPLHACIKLLSVLNLQCAEIFITMDEMMLMNYGKSVSLLTFPMHFFVFIYNLTCVYR